MEQVMDSARRVNRELSVGEVLNEPLRVKVPSRPAHSGRVVGYTAVNA
jgi:hypothetical protein